MKIIKLKHGLETQVDDDIWLKYCRYKWYASKKGFLSYIQCYRKGQMIYLHRLIMNCPTGMEVDHLDGNPFNNQRSNLAVKTKQANLYNRRGYNGNGVKTNEPAPF